MVHCVICCAAPFEAVAHDVRVEPIAEIVSTVSRRLSPLFTLLDETEKFMTSARAVAAVSKLMRLRVESSKNTLTTVLPRKAGTFGMGRG